MGNAKSSSGRRGQSVTDKSTKSSTLERAAPTGSTAAGGGAGRGGLTRAQSVPDATQLAAAADVSLHTGATAAGGTPGTDGQPRQITRTVTIPANLTTSSKKSDNDVTPAAPTTPSSLSPQQQQPPPLTNPAVASSYNHSAETLDVYRRVADQVLLIWNDLSPLRTVDPSSIDAPLLKTLTDVLRRLAEQYSHIRQLQGESRDHKEQLQKNVTKTQQQLAVKQTEIDKLNEKISSLEKELKSRPVSPAQLTVAVNGDRHPAERTAVATKTPLPEVDYDDGRSPPDGGRDVGRIHDSPSSMSSGSSELGSPRSRDVSSPRSRDFSKFGAELDIVRQLELELAEQQRENMKLRYRLKQDVSQDGMESRRPRQIAQLTELYERLEDDAIGKLFIAVKHHTAPGVSDVRRSLFICDVIQSSYAVALAARASFDDVIASLLADPARLSGDVTLSEMTSLLAGEKLPAPKLHGSNSSSKLGGIIGRSSLSSRVTSLLDEARHDVTMTQTKNDCYWLIEQLIAFIDNRSDVIDLAPLVESVVSTLRRLYPDCCQPALVGPAAATQTFNRFIGQCCQLSWQLVTSQPQFFLATTCDGSDGRFSAQLHATLMQDATARATIDHYLWPVLFDRRGGRVLHRGRVVLKQNTAF